MNITRELLLHLETATALVVGTDLFMGVLPAGIETGILLYEFSGSQNYSGLKSSSLQIAVVKDDYDTANDTIHSLWDVLVFNNGLTLDSGQYLLNIVPLKYPGFVTTTEHDKFLFTCSIVIYFE